MAERQTIVVDIETNGLDLVLHQAVEVAWWNMDTGARGEFVPPHDVSAVLAQGSIKAFQVNGYIDRVAEAEQDNDGVKLAMLICELEGNTLAGSNPRFDAAMLNKVIWSDVNGLNHNTDIWHYRLLDLGAYAMGVLGLDDVPGLWDVCQALDVEPETVHAAASGVDTTMQCFRALASIVSGRKLDKEF